ncbi:tetratricopeptide repeat protein [Lysinibacillus boronitolerans]|uniref:Uncharacterized protein n=1 Tax=Lysinibacillus boronitolerans JCM 21713 = 10a = NBRC 103108 TaxID=1294264 RepID=A0ABR4Y2N4_9BACI|nr:hypothetical protein [Lysinibacillus boronitolerans]KGR86923.1 hypothetical protein CD31_08565 [Lysinibacillus boronitolerans JCM 21713 = 10a = NBRC 103108]
MDELKIMQTINYIEKNLPVKNWKINEIDFWPIFRIVTSLNLLKSKSKINNEIYEITKNPKEIPSLSHIFDDKDIDIIFLSDSQYRVKLNSIWYNRLSDPFYEISKRMGYKAINLDFSYQNAGKVPVIENTYSLQNQLIASQDLENLENLDLKLDRFEEVREKILYLTKDENDVPDISKVKWMATQILYWKERFREIILQKKIKSVFIVNYYQLISYALILAARELNIPSIDIQHGNQRSVYYHNWNSIPVNGFNTLPTYFWCWSKEHGLPIKTWVSKTERHDVVIGGNPWTEMWKNEESTLTKFYDQEVNKYLNNSNINILFTVQPLYPLVGWKYNIPNWVIEVIRVSPPNWKFYIRYHQQMLHKYKNEHDFCEKQLAEFITKRKVETLKATNLPLPALLKHVDIHITAFSTCVIEAKEFNVPSITLHDSSKLFFQKEIENGWVVEAKTKYEILQAIDKQKKFKEKINETIIDNSKTLFESTFFKIVDNIKSPNFDSGSLRKEILFSIYFTDQEFEKIVNNYEGTDSYKEALYVALAYKELGDLNNEMKFTIIALEKALKNRKKIKKRDILLFTNRLISEECFENYAEDFVSLIEERTGILGEIFKQFFDEQKYDQILKLCKYFNKLNLDSLYYSGRALIHKNNLVEALEKLKMYTLLYDNINETAITKSNNFIISAFFYMGKIHIEQKNNELAAESLKKCLEYSDGNHQKASELLKELF